MKALILVGGQSSRMGSDKAELNYHGVPQSEYLKEMLTPLCEKVFYSYRADQQSGEEIINDKYDIKGPTAGILSAMDEFPNTPWLVIACDLPYLTSKDIEHLIMNRDKTKIATCYENPEKKWAEPLCTIWEPSSKNRLLEFVEKGSPCPRKTLMNSEIHCIPTLNPMTMVNANTPEEFQKAKEQLHAN